MKMKRVLLGAVLGGSAVVALFSHAAPSFSDRTTARIGTNRVAITVSGGERVVTANGLPDHIPGQFPNRGNPNTISAQNYTFHIPVNPQVAPRSRDGRGAWFGVALNGIPFEPGTGEFWN